MPAPICSDEEFIRLFEAMGATALANHLGTSERGVYKRRRNLEKGRSVITAPTMRESDVPGRLRFDLDDGMIVCGSDAHFWPGIISTAHRAFVRFCREFRPKIVVMNGDVFDGASISRHPPIGWEDSPGVKEEIEACKDRLGEIVVAAEDARRVWNLGNHDARFETRLAQVAPEYAKVHGVHLADHFPDWEKSWSCWINDDIVIKHRNKGGIHATHNNTLWAGKTMVTGHLHSLKVTPFSDYAGTRWGVDTGTMAVANGPQFQGYLEDNPVNWRSGFAALTIRRGKLLWPEVIHVIDEGAGEVEFRGKVYTV